MSHEPQVEEIAPLSFFQQYVWFLLQYKDAGPARFNANLVIELFGALDVHHLGEALAVIEERHGPLRTCVRLVNGQPHQVILPPSAGPLPVRDLSALGEAEQEIALEAAVREEVELPIDIVHGPLHRARLLRLGANNHVLLWTANHISVDFWSYRNLLDELRALYGAGVEARAPRLPHLPVRYAAFTRTQRAKLAPDDRRVAFWRNYLAGAESYRPPHRQPRAQRPSPELTRWAPLDPILRERITELSRQLSCTRFSVVLAALARVAERWSGATDVVALIAAGHRTAQTRHLIGSFADLLPVRIPVSSARTSSDLVRLSHSAILKTLLHELPLRRIEEITGRAYPLTFGITDHVPFYNRHDDPRQRLLRQPSAAEIACGQFAADISFRASALPMRMYRIDLLFMLERDIVLCNYQPDLFTAETIDKSLSWFLEALEAITRSPNDT